MITVQVTGDDPKKISQHMMEVLENKRGNVYPLLTQDMQEAIRRNADPCYASSPALTMAIESAEHWKHSEGRHLLDIYSTDYANYRQYGCGGLPITILVDVTAAEMDTMTEHIITEIENAVK